MSNHVSVNVLVGHAILNYRDFVLKNTDICHMWVRATPKFLADNPHLKGHVASLKHFGDIVILNITPRAIGPIEFDYPSGMMSFPCRFGGKEHYNFVVMGDIVGLTSPGGGAVLDPTSIMAYTVVDDGLVYTASRPIGSEHIADESNTPTPVEKPKERPALKLVR